MNWLKMMKAISLAVNIAAQEAYEKMAGVIIETARNNSGTVIIATGNH